VVRGYHGTSVKIAAAICANQRITVSENEWDWLGRGCYFWEDGLHRAWEWAMKHHADEPAVVSVPIRFGKCLNLCDGNQYPILQAAHATLAEEAASQGSVLPSNSSDLRHPLDCLVVNFVCDHILDDIETVRAPFQEGDPVYPGAALTRQAHVHLCVKRPSAYVGSLRPEPWG
jgi:hypothetical protein